MAISLSLEFAQHLINRFIRPKHFVLVDLENVNLDYADDLKGHEVLVFVGADQRIAQTLKFRFIRAAKNGKNALDFLLAYYLGMLSERHPKAIFSIISGDRGFDALIDHMNSKAYKISRYKSFHDLLQTNPCQEQPEYEPAQVRPSRLEKSDKTPAVITKMLDSLI